MQSLPFGFLLDPWLFKWRDANILSEGQRGNFTCLNIICSNNLTLKITLNIKLGKYTTFLVLNRNFPFLIIYITSCMVAYQFLLCLTKPVVVINHNCFYSRSSALRVVWACGLFPPRLAPHAQGDWLFLSCFRFRLCTKRLT